MEIILLLKLLHELDYVKSVYYPINPYLNKYNMFSFFHHCVLWVPNDFPYTLKQSFIQHLLCTCYVQCN